MNLKRDLIAGTGPTVDRRGALALCGAGAALLLSAGRAHAQGYPARPVTLIVPYAAGGATDLLGRAVSQGLGKELGQSFVVQNVPGAGATLGAAQAAAAAPDGYTLLITGSSTLVMAPHLYAKLKYDPLTAFAPIGKVATSSYVLMVRAGAGIDRYEQLVARAKAAPGKLNYGSPGMGTSLHLTIELMLEGSGMDVVHVPYGGTAPVWNALLGGNVDFMIDSPSGAVPMVRAGKAVPLAVTSAQRDPQLPDVPTLREKGLNGFESMAWFSLLAPAGTPPPVVARLRQALLAARVDPILVDPLTKAGFAISTDDPALLMDEIRRESARWGKVIAAHHIQLDK